MKRLTYLFAALLLVFSGMAQTHLDLAEHAMSSEDYASAIEHCTEQLKTNPKDVKALVMRTWAYAAAGDIIDAFADINDAIKFWNKNTKDLTLSNLYIVRSYLYQEIDETAKALDDLNTAVKKGKKDADNYSERGDFYYQLEEYAKAKADYEMAVKLEPKNAQHHIEVGRSMLALQEFDKADDYFEKLVKLFPNEEEALRLYAVTKFYKEDYISFIDLYVSYLENDGSGNLNLLYIAAQEEYVYAIRAITDKVSSSYKKDYWRKIRAHIYREHRQYAEALSDLRYIELTDSILDIYTLREFCAYYEETEDFTKALEYYNRLIKRYEDADVEDAFNYLKRGIVYRELGEYVNTIKDCDRALSISMDYAGFAYYLKGWAHELGGDNDAAFDDYNKSIMYDETYAYSYLMRGEQYLVHRHDTINAMKDFERILELDTIVTDGSCRQYALMFLGKTDEAKAWMAQILEAEPDNAGHYYDAACLYARMGELDEAMNYLRLAFEHGYRRFQHLEADDDMDPLRNRQDYKDLINQYKKEKLTNLFNQL